MQAQANIHDTYKSLIQAQLDLYSFVKPKPEEDINIPGVPGAVLSYENGIIKFTIPEIPPLSKENGGLDKKINEHWIGLMAYAYHKSNIKITLTEKKNMCIINVYHTSVAPWDVDNRTYKHIIDGLRYLRLIKDDSSKYLSYMVNGKEGSDVYMTEVILVDNNLVNDKLNEIGILIP